MPLTRSSSQQQQHHQGLGAGGFPVSLNAAAAVVSSEKQVGGAHPSSHFAVQGQQPRAILGEINTNIEDMAPKKANKGRKKKRAPRGGRRSKPQSPVKSTLYPGVQPVAEVQPDVIDDVEITAVTDAVKTACEDLMRPPQSGGGLTRLLGSKIYQVPMHDRGRAITPPSPAVREAGRLLSARPTPPSLEYAVRGSDPPERREKLMEYDAEGGESFIVIIQSRSPVKQRGETDAREKENRDPQLDGVADEVVGKSGLSQPCKNRDSFLKDLARKSRETSLRNNYEIPTGMKAVKLVTADEASDKLETSVACNAQDRPKESEPVHVDMEQDQARCTPTASIYPDSSKDSTPKSTMQHATPENSVVASSRIEDSVEAIDVMEDAISEVGETLTPSQQTQRQKETKTKKSETPARSGLKLVDLEEFGVRPFTRSPSLPIQPSIETDVMSDMSSRKNASSGTTTTNTNNNNTLKTSTLTITTKGQWTKVTKTVTSSSHSPVVVKPLDTKRATTTGRQSTMASNAASRPSSRRTSRAPVKSSKPLTTPAFELPGEAISRRLRQQREERLNREEEERQKKRVFKAKPIRQSLGPTLPVKGNAASRARASLAGTKTTTTLEGAAGKSSAPPKRAFVTGTGGVSASSLAAQPRHRQTTLAIRKRPSNYAEIFSAPAPFTTPTPAPTPAPVVTAPSSSSTAASTTTKATNSRKTSAASQQQLPSAVAKATVTPAEVPQRAKEPVKREWNDKLEAVLLSKQEKEAVAKKARKEAAERSRMASREWAQRRKMKVGGDGKKDIGSVKNGGEEKVESRGDVGGAREAVVEQPPSPKENEKGSQTT